jgi:hypothetical protein
VNRARRLPALVAAACIGVAFIGMSGRVSAAPPLGDNTVKLAPSLLKLPQNIGPLRYSTENRYSDRRMGRSFAYNASGISLNIFVYDYGVRDLPEGPDSVDACEQFESAKAEIENGGNYQNVRLRAEVARRLRADSPLSAREAVYEFERNGLSALSVLWLTSADGFFIKLRLSMRTEIADELDDARDQILGSITDAINARERGALPAPVASTPAPASIEMNAGGDPADAPMWLAYAMELSRYATEHPDSGPPCGGVYVPRFELEVEARRAALREYRARAANGRHSAYFDALSRVEAAGLLDEYTWALLHQARWGKAPDHELAMGSFEEFRARELPGHVAQSGALVRIRAVRVLPPPAAP